MHKFNANWGTVMYTDLNRDLNKSTCFGLLLFLLFIIFPNYPTARWMLPSTDIFLCFIFSMFKWENTSVLSFKINQRDHGTKEWSKLFFCFSILIYNGCHTLECVALSFAAVEQFPVTLCCFILYSSSVFAATTFSVWL